MGQFGRNFARYLESWFERLTWSFTLVFSQERLCGASVICPEPAADDFRRDSFPFWVPEAGWDRDVPRTMFHVKHAQKRSGKYVCGNARERFNA